MERELEGTREKVAYEDNRSVLLYLNRQNVNYDTHWHTAAEIIMPLENDYQVTTNERQYTLGPWDILFIPPGELHTLNAPPTGQRLILMFDLSVLSAFEDFSTLTPILSQPILITQDSNSEIHDTEVGLLKSVIEEYQHRAEPMRITMIYSYLLRFFVHLGRQHIRADVIFPEVRLGKQMEYVEKLNNVVSYINSNFAEEISLEKAASLAGFSKFHFFAAL